MIACTVLPDSAIYRQFRDFGRLLGDKKNRLSPGDFWQKSAIWRFSAIFTWKLGYLRYFYLPKSDDFSAIFKFLQKSPTAPKNVWIGDFGKIISGNTVRAASKQEPADRQKWTFSRKNTIFSDFFQDFSKSGIIIEPIECLKPWFLLLQCWIGYR